MNAARRFSIASVTGLSAGSFAKEELRSAASRARDHSRRAIERMAELMESSDEKVALGACLGMLKAGGVLGYGEADAKVQAGIEQGVRAIFEQARAKLPPSDPGTPSNGCP